MSRPLPVLLILILLVFGCEQGPVETDRQNAPEHLNKPYVMLISLDGFRHDYIARYQPPYLSQFAAEGVSARSLLSCFPSKTFPNHYSIATGMYPERHRLVSNTFYDPQMDQVFRIGNRDAVEDSAWYGGTPLWVLAEQQGMVSASYFFVGTEAPIQGVHPTYYYRYDGSVPNADRVNQALAWLELPPERRPHFMTLYFSDMDNAGHRYSPSDEEKIRATLMDLDAELGRLFRGVAETELPVNIIIVSDHGMATVQSDQYINLDRVLDDDRYRTVSNGAFLHIYPRPGVDPARLRDSLNALEGPWKAYTIEEFPFYTQNRAEPRLGKVLVVTDYPHYFASGGRITRVGALGSPTGTHGYDPRIPEMGGIFYAKGPDVIPGDTLESFENVHIYPLVCKLLGLTPPKEIDGRMEVLEGIVRREEAVSTP